MDKNTGLTFGQALDVLRKSQVVSDDVILFQLSRVGFDVQALDDIVRVLVPSVAGIDELVAVESAKHPTLVD